MTAAPAPDLGALPGLPRDGEAPVFRAPWEAQVFAMTLSLHRQGVFAWTEWAETLGARLAAAAEAGGAQDGSDYYLRWLEALEDMAIAKGAADPQDLIATADAWSSAAAATPHGQPIRLPGGRGRQDG